jgi:hypothetical protein
MVPQLTVAKVGRGLLRHKDTHLREFSSSCLVQAAGLWAEGQELLPRAGGFTAGGDKARYAGQCPPKVQGSSTTDLADPYCH